MAARLDSEQKAAIDRVVVDMRLPPWFWIARAQRQLRPVDEAERVALIGALDVLTRLV
jgi:hypothetical protein